MLSIVNRANQVIHLLIELLTICENYTPTRVTVLEDTPVKEWKDEKLLLTFRDFVTTSKGEKNVRQLTTDYANLLLLEDNFDYNASRYILFR